MYCIHVEYVVVKCLFELQHCRTGLRTWIGDAAELSMARLYVLPARVSGLPLSHNIAAHIIITIS